MRPRRRGILEVAIRATAVGVGLGLAASAGTIALSTGLAEQPDKALWLAGLIVCVYVGLAWGAVALLSIAGAALAFGGAPGRTLVSAPVVWTIALLLVGRGALKDAGYAFPAFQPWRSWSTLLLAALASLAAVWSIRRRLETGPRWHRLEWALAGLAPLGVLLALGFFAQAPPEAGREPVDPGVALAPRFDPEPAEAFASSRAEARPRVLLVGVDGASWDRIDAGIAAGRLPTFQRLVERGRRAALASLYPTHSPRIWTTIATGVSPEEHGIDHFYHVHLPRLGVEALRVPRAADLVEDVLESLGELRRVPVTSSLRRRKALWNLADEAGLRSVLIGLWASWPPEPLRNGVVVSDHAGLAHGARTDGAGTRRSRESVTIHPAALEERLASLQRSPESVTREELARFLPVDDALWREFESVEGFSEDEKLSAFRSSHLIDAFRFAVARELWSAERPDLLFVYVKALDELSHFFYEAGVPEAPDLGWKPVDIARYAEVVDRVYEWTDRELAPLVAAVDQDPGVVLIVMSDHGWEREWDGGYNHNFAPPGILVFYGAGVCRGECPTLGDPSVYDVAPTVLERLRLPLSGEFRGRPLSHAFVDPHPPVRVAGYGGPLEVARGVASERDAALNEKLEALGYVE